LERPLRKRAPLQKKAMLQKKRVTVPQAWKATIPASRAVVPLRSTALVHWMEA
jgi:hypothetical protein